jgi:HSP20 family protein
MFTSLFSGQDTSLFDEFRRLENEVSQLLGQAPWPMGIRAAQHGAFPPMNIGSTPERVTVYLFAAGLDPAKLDLSIQQNLLTVSGSRQFDVKADADYYRQELFSGEFRRAITLPEDVDPKQVTATYRNGVLEIAIARRESTRPRQITVS